MKVYPSFFLILLVGVILTFQRVDAQNTSDGVKSEEALSAEGVKKINEKKYDEAIAIFDKLIALDSLKPEYRYEKAFALYLKQDYPKAIALLEKLAEGVESNPLYYQLLGNSYDYLGQQDKAVDAYQAGLRRFPNSGRLFLELGTLEMSRHDFGQALAYWENGINTDPSFVSNYYWAAKFNAQTAEKIWTLIYGEIFLNLEPDTKRSAEISEVLFKIYKTAFKADTGGVLKFSQQRTIIQGENVAPNRQPLEVAFEKTMTDAARPFLKNNPRITLELMSRIRAEFIREWRESGYPEIYSNILFDRHEEMMDAGVFKAYNMWLLHHGDPDAFKKWAVSNKAEFKKFYDWVQKNPMIVNEQRRFNRYE